jgi:hypothetical protein
VSPRPEQRQSAVRVAVSSELSAWIAARIANYEAEATELYQRWEASAVKEFAALPLIRHWYETFGLRSDGEMVRWYTDGPDVYSGVRPVESRYDWLSALVDGAWRYPQLQVLIPKREAGTADCRCVGHPEFGPGRIICPECCGLGWVGSSSDVRR